MGVIYKLVWKSYIVVYVITSSFLVYICTFACWRFLFTFATYFLIFQCNFTMSSTIRNDVINVKPYWVSCVWILIICFLVRNIDTWAISTASQYKFPVWQCMIIMRIWTYCSLFNIRLFGINMTSIQSHCIFVCFLYVIFFSTDLIFWAFLFLSLSFSNTDHARIATMHV